jgi:hypothetical protein
MHHLADEAKDQALLAYENFVNDELRSRPAYRLIAALPQSPEVMELFKLGFLAGYAATVHQPEEQPS